MTTLCRSAGRVSVRGQATGLRAVAVVVLVFASEAPCAEAPARDKVAQGQELFAREWVANDPRCHGGDGLGPVYNETSCVGCHNLGGPGGGGPVSKNVEIVTLNGLTTKLEELEEYHPGFRKAPSLILHHFGTDPDYRLWRLRRVEGVEYSELAGEGGEGELEVIKRVVTGQSLPRTHGRILLDIGKPGRNRGRALVRGRTLLGEVSTVSGRNPPPLWGAGLIDSIPTEVLHQLADKQFRDNPNITGRPSIVEPGRIGRFGWKAQVATLDDFVRSACANELGLQNPGHPQSESPLVDTPKSHAMDLTREECDALVAYVGQLPAPNHRRMEEAITEPKIQIPSRGKPSPRSGARHHFGASATRRLICMMAGQAPSIRPWPFTAGKDGILLCSISS
jgi:cytochrome c553